ncbi:methylated-DNA--[protein]-cysteine S-methyltransferase [Chitinophaga lutea]|uniref:Methylated-DNA--protein-cysteine methyltransferase n=2 Tax=Chitinophaga lutea TaxID=2488634 RepID=A0A3N4PJW5_9BACT|nr:methylated-DNA--[protein]-cysteine S-methyltransferase [Chitinophaga lutea]
MQPSTAGDPSTQNRYRISMPSPVGRLLIEGTEHHINAVLFTDEGEESPEVPPLLHLAVKQLQEYFDKTRRTFDFPMQQEGTPFQQAVWHQLTTIPFGETITYLALAKRVGNVKSIRAVGTTNGRNNLAIVVPCHRVIGSGGVLTGYAGGLWRKQWLLDHEGGGTLF